MVSLKDIENIDRLMVENKVDLIRNLKKLQNLVQGANISLENMIDEIEKYNSQQFKLSIKSYAQSLDTLDQIGKSMEKLSMITKAGLMRLR